MHKQRLLPGQKAIHNLAQPLRARLASRKSCGPYIVTPGEPITGAHDVFFYLDSDFAPGLRWSWCDTVATGIRHTGWFTDEDGIGEKIRGVVMRLPQGRGFLAGWSMGEGMASVVSTYAYPDAIGAAYGADSMAEHVAEAERQYQYEQEQEALEAEQLAREEQARGIN